MAFHNYLRVQTQPDDVKRILHVIQSKDAGPGSIDFNAITPMPQWVYSKQLDHDTADARAQECWLAWRQEQWGTRWNAIDAAQSAKRYDGGDTIFFMTKETDVRDLMRKLSLMFPQAVFDYLWSDEDIGKAAGALQYTNGAVTFSYLPRQESRDAYELAFDVLHGTAQEYGLALDPHKDTYFYVMSTELAWEEPAQAPTDEKG